MNTISPTKMICACLITAFACLALTLSLIPSGNSTAVAQDGQAQPSRVAFVDIQRVLKDYEYITEELEAISNEYDEEIEKVQAKDRAQIDKQREARANNPVGSNAWSSATKSHSELIQKQLEEAQSTTQYFEGMRDRAFLEAHRDALDAIEEITKGKYDTVLNAPYMNLKPDSYSDIRKIVVAAPVVQFTPAERDITQDVIDLLNKRYQESKQDGD